MPSSGMSPPPFMQNDAVMPRALDRWSHLSPWPRNTRSIFGPKTRMIVVVVDNCVRKKPRKYFMSGPACGKRHKLRKKEEKKRKRKMMKNGNLSWKIRYVRKNGNKIATLLKARITSFFYSISCINELDYLMSCDRDERNGWKIWATWVGDMKNEETCGISINLFPEFPHPQSATCFFHSLTHSSIRFSGKPQAEVNKQDKFFFLVTPEVNWIFFPYLMNITKFITDLISLILWYAPWDIDTYCIVAMSVLTKAILYIA